MKILILALVMIAAVAVVALQRQQVGHLRAENATLAQASSEAGQLRADLAKFTGANAQDAADEIARLREENHDLLRLRNEVNQLRDTKAQFEKVSAENQRLQAQARNAPKVVVKESSMQPILIKVENLYNQGLSTPENTVQTFFWSQREGNVDWASRCVTSESWASVRDDFSSSARSSFFKNMVSIEIVARREVNSSTVQLGIQLHAANNRGSMEKAVFTLTLRDGEWRLDLKNM